MGHRAAEVHSSDSQLGLSLRGRTILQDLPLS